MSSKEFQKIFSKLASWKSGGSTVKISSIDNDDKLEKSSKSKKLDTYLNDSISFSYNGDGGNGTIELKSEGDDENVCYVINFIIFLGG